MSNLYFPLPVPIADGDGFAVNVMDSTRIKTIVVSGEFSGMIFIQGSCDGVNFENIARFDDEEEKFLNVDDTIAFIRVRRTQVIPGTPAPFICMACPFETPIVGTVTANQGLGGASPWLVTVDAASGLATEFTLQNVLAAVLNRATEVTLAAINFLLTAALDVTLSSRASEATLATRATEATLIAANGHLASLDADIDVPLSSRASEATLATRASEATLLTRATEATLATRATEATLATRATEATLLTRLSKADFEARINTQGQKLQTVSTPVALSTSDTATHSDVPGSAVVVTLQASNANRVGWTMTNEAVALSWFVRFGVGATLTNYDVEIRNGVYFELPFKYTGIITGIQSIAQGTARIAEFT